MPNDCVNKRYGGALAPPDEALEAAPATIGRQRLPALDSLRFFEAAARHASFTKAAKELFVTQGAVSHRVQALEAELGIILFRRLTRRLELTAEGEHLAAGVREGIACITRAVAGLNIHAESGPLSVSMLPSFASRWMVPRLPRFQATHPEVEVRVLAEDEPADLRAAHGPELAIRFGRGNYPDLFATPLMPDSVVPVCSPELVERHGAITSVDALLDLPLLHDSMAERDDSGTGWKAWLAHVGAGSDDPRLTVGLRFSHAHLAIEAALLGQGVALARTSLVGDDLARGRLVRPMPQAAPTIYQYFLLCRPELAQRRKIVLFRDWLVAEAQRAAGVPSVIV